MPRKKKITNAALKVLNFDRQIDNAPITKTNTMYNIVNYGERNDYPTHLISLYNTSVTMKACADFATNAIIGEGIDLDAMQTDSGNLQNPNYYTSWTEFVRALAFDFTLFSAFAFQIIKNKDGKTYSFFHQPIETVRLEEFDEDGVINNAYICKDWSNPTKYPPVKMPMFGFQDDKVIPTGEPYLFYHKQYNPVSPYYGLPTYTSAINCIQAEAQYQLYDLKTITNGFTATGALTLPEVETDEERNAIIRDITRLFTSAENANSILISFRRNPEEKGVEFTPFVQQSSNVDLYNGANERTVNRIMAGFKIPSKALIGFPADNTGFSDSGAYLESAFALYNVNVANNSRREILDVINNMFKMNGVETKIVLKPLSYRIQEGNTPSENVSGTEPVNEDDATEREDGTL